MGTGRRGPVTGRAGVVPLSGRDPAGGTEATRSGFLPVSVPANTTELLNSQQSKSHPAALHGVVAVFICMNGGYSIKARGACYHTVTLGYNCRWSDQRINSCQIRLLLVNPNSIPNDNTFPLPHSPGYGGISTLPSLAPVVEQVSTVYQRRQARGMDHTQLV